MPSAAPPHSGGEGDWPELWSRKRRSVADDAVVRSLFEEHGKAMLAYASRLTGDWAAAEDIVQEALVRGWRNPDVLENGKGSVRGWLLTVVRNLVTDRHRARTRRPAEVPEMPHCAAAHRDHSDGIVDSVMVSHALERLSHEHREVVLEIYYRGRSVKEAADVLGIPPGTVKSRTYYALRAMRAAVEDRGTVTEGAVG